MLQTDSGTKIKSTKNDSMSLQESTMSSQNQQESTLKNKEYLQQYKPTNTIRFVSATALFDGHDASINIMRRLLQARGAEVIHLGHNRSAEEIANAAIQEDAQGIAISSYQGGHMEFFKYVRQLINGMGGEQIQIFGGGGGVITLDEIEELKEYGCTIYSPEVGQYLGLQGMIGDILKSSDFKIKKKSLEKKPGHQTLSRCLSLFENKVSNLDELKQSLEEKNLNSKNVPILGITGTGGAGKSSLLDELLIRFLDDFSEIRIGILCIDPSKKKTGGALLGDRIRINSCADQRIYLRSIASRGAGIELSNMTKDAVELMKYFDFDFIIVETSGIGQGDSQILDVSDLSLYVMTPEYGASSQLEKIDMLDFANFIAVNKYERRQGPDAIKDLQLCLRRSRYQGVPPQNSDYPIFGTIASRFNDDGTNGLYKAICEDLVSRGLNTKGQVSPNRKYNKASEKRDALIPTERNHYLFQISKTIKDYQEETDNFIEKLKKLEAFELVLKELEGETNKETQNYLNSERKKIEQEIPQETLKALQEWPKIAKNYNSDYFTYRVRDREIKVASKFETLAHLKLPRIALPKHQSKAELLNFLRKENLPGSFPFTGGLFPFRRKNEEPKRQFAGEGGPAKTNKRFHYLSEDEPAKRLSTAFDSVTLYGSNPNIRPDIYGKVGESGVSIAHLDDMKVLYDGFDLCSPNTSISMTINGPAPMLLAMFLNTAIDQQVVKFEQEHKRTPNKEEYNSLKKFTLQSVRGTVQADILKEDQAQNTCIFSTEFALKMMGDIQEYFIENNIKNYYAVSISGYHIAEAGANPISQLAFTLANGFTYVEYYLKRGFHIDDFAPNLSFFFSNGLDSEYTVIGRVARRIWSIAMRNYYKGNERSQKLKYHVQTSGRSLHAQEMDFNDIRTTLQALLALYDNCNSLHTNAFDEAVTTPTEDSVRRAMAIQMIINNELGSNKCENINQGSYFVEELTDLVEEAVLDQFEKISTRGGVLGAMETQYQRNVIQEESLYYEHLKHEGTLPIVGVNCFKKVSKDGEWEVRQETGLVRSSYEEKDHQIMRLEQFKEKNCKHKEAALASLREAVLQEKNIFSELMSTVRYVSLGEISELLYKVGGQYRRSM